MSDYNYSSNYNTNTPISDYLASILKKPENSNLNYQQFITTDTNTDVKPSNFYANNLQLNNYPVKSDVYSYNFNPVKETTIPITNYSIDSKYSTNSFKNFQSDFDINKINMHNYNYDYKNSETNANNFKSTIPTKELKLENFISGRFPTSEKNNENDITLQKFRDEIKSKAEKYEILLGKSSNDEGMILKLKETLNSKEENINNLTSKIIENEKAIIKFQEDLTVKEFDLKKIQEKLTANNRQYEEFTQLEKEKNQEILNLNEKNKKLNNDIHEIKISYDTEVDKFINDIEELKLIILDRQNVIREFEQIIKNQELIIEEFKNTNSNNLQNLENEKIQNEEISNLKKRILDIEELNKQILLEFQEKFKNYRQENSRTPSDDPTVELINLFLDLELTINNLNSENKKLKSDLSDLNISTNQENKNSESQNQELKKLNLDLEYRLSVLLLDNQDLNQKILDLGSKFEMLTENKLHEEDLICSTNPNIYANQIQELEYDNQHFLSELDEKNSKIRELILENNEIKNSKENINLELLTLQDRLKFLNLLENEIQTLRKQNTDKDIMIQDLTKQITQNSTSLIRKEAEVNSLKNDRTNSLSKSYFKEFPELNSLEKKVDLLNTSLNEIRELKERIKLSDFNRSYHVNVNKTELEINQIRKSNLENKIFNHINNVHNNQGIPVNQNLKGIDTGMLSKSFYDVIENNNQDELSVCKSSNNTHVKECVSDITKNNFKKENFIEPQQIIETLLIQEEDFLDRNPAESIYLNQDQGKCKRINLNNELSPIFQTKQEEQTRKNHSSNVSQNISVTGSIANLELNLTNGNWNSINSWVNQTMNKNNNYKYNLLYKASKEDYDISKFQNLCHGKGPNLVVLMTNFNKIIGGFTPLVWRKSEGTYEFVCDDSGKSFIFSLSLDEKYELKKSRVALTYSIDNGPIFGLNDIEILNHFHDKHTFASGSGSSYEYNKSVQELFGDKLYKIVDFEFYHLSE